MLIAISQILNGLPILKNEQNAPLAALLAFLFGGIGLGIYLRSWIDFGVSFAIGIAVFVLTELLIPGSNLWLIAATIVGLYGYLRVVNSNQRREARFHAPRPAQP